MRRGLVVLALSLAGLTRAKLTVRVNDTEWTSELCADLLIRQNVDVPIEVDASFNDTSIANFAQLSDADRKAFCSKEPLDGEPFKGKWLLFHVIKELCWAGSYPSRHSYYTTTMQLVETHGALGALRIGQGEPSKRGPEQNPVVSMYLDYGLDRKWDSLIERSFYCAPLEGDPSGLSDASLTGLFLGTYPTDSLRLHLEKDDGREGRRTNPWKDTFESPFYIGFFSIIAPLLNVYMVFLALRTANELRKERTKSGTALDLNSKLVLGIEVVANSLLALYGFITGHYARSAPAMYSFFFYAGLGGLGMCTTFLTALFWGILKEQVLSMRVRNRDSQTKFFRARSRQVGIVCVFFVILDLVAPINTNHDIPLYEKIQGGLLAAGQLAVAVYFIREVSTTLTYITNALAKSNVASTGGKGSAGATRLHVVAKWLFGSALFMILYVLVAFTAITGFLWDPVTGWPMSWCLFFISRTGTAFTQVKAVGVSSTKGKQSSKVDAERTAQGPSSTVVSSTANSVAVTQDQSGGGNKSTDGGISKKGTNGTSAAVESSVVSTNRGSTINGSSRFESTASAEGSIAEQ